MENQNIKITKPRTYNARTAIRGTEINDEAKNKGKKYWKKNRCVVKKVKKFIKLV